MFNVPASSIFFAFLIFFYDDDGYKKKKTKNTFNNASTAIHCAVGKKTKFKMLNSNNSWHRKFLKKSDLNYNSKVGQQSLMKY